MSFETLVKDLIECGNMKVVNYFLEREYEVKFSLKGDKNELLHSSNSFSAEDSYDRINFDGVRFDKQYFKTGCELFNQTYHFFGNGDSEKLVVVCCGSNVYLKRKTPLSVKSDIVLARTEERFDSPEDLFARLKDVGAPYVGSLEESSAEGYIIDPSSSAVYALCVSRSSVVDSARKLIQIELEYFGHFPDNKPDEGVVVAGLEGMAEELCKFGLSVSKLRKYDFVRQK